MKTSITNINRIALGIWLNWAKENGYQTKVWDSWMGLEPIYLVFTGETNAHIEVAFKESDAMETLRRMFPNTCGKMVVDYRLNGFTYDTAVPHEWMMRYIAECRLRPFLPPVHEHVWLYDGKAPVFGRPFHIWGEENPQGVPDQSMPNPIDSRSGVGGSERFD